MQMEVVRKLIREALYEMDRSKKTAVQFDKNTEYPYEVEFSERGFVVYKVQKDPQTGKLARSSKFPANQRLSFEEIQDSLNKKIDLQLNSDKGDRFELNQVRMQSIMKYKDLYNAPQQDRMTY